MFLIGMKISISVSFAYEPHSGNTRHLAQCEARRFIPISIDHRREPWPTHKAFSFVKLDHSWPEHAVQWIFLCPAQRPIITLLFSVKASAAFFSLILYSQLYIQCFITYGTSADGEHKNNEQSLYKSLYKNLILFQNHNNFCAPVMCNYLPS